MNHFEKSKQIKWQIAESPVFPDRSFLVTDFGARGDSTFLNTKCIQSAIDTAHQAQGGRVIIPEGIFLCGSLVLKSNVELYLEKGAVLLGSTDRSHYQCFSRWYAFILAEGQSNMAISGKGTIDGQGRELALNIDQLYHAGKIKEENYHHKRNRPQEKERVQIIEMVNCAKINITGITIKNASCWVQTYVRCRFLTIDHILVKSNAFWNNDGIDIVDCQDVAVSHCDLDTADDGICLKSDDKKSCNERITIAHCRIRSSSCAVKMGTESHGGFKNVLVHDILVYDTYRSAIAIESVDGAKVENIHVSDITAIHCGNAFFVRLGQRNDQNQSGYMKNIQIKNIKAEISYSRADQDYPLRGPGLSFFHNPIPASITGIPGYSVQSVYLENIEIIYPGKANRGMAYIPVKRITSVPENRDGYPEFTMFEELPCWGLYLRHIDCVDINNFILRLKDNDFRPAIVGDDIKSLNLKAIDLPRELKNEQIILHQVQNHVSEFF